MTFTEPELNYIISAMQIMSNRQEAFLQQQCNCDSRTIYVKLLDLIETIPHAN